MAKTDQEVIQALNRLYSIVDAGERGYATTALNVQQRGLKMLFKANAQQRANFKAEIQDEIERLGGELSHRSSILGAIHRGRVAIFSAMIIEDRNRERAVLKEAAVGEGHALRTYERTLNAGLPVGTSELVHRQYDEVKKDRDQLLLLRGHEGKRMVMHLYDSEGDAEAAVRLLTEAGFPRNAIDKIDISDSVEHYRGRGASVFETILSGGFGGLFWATLIGILAATGVVQSGQAGMIELPSTLGVVGVWILTALVVIVLGTLVGAALGLVIGVGIAEDDVYDYRQSIKHGEIIVRTVADEARAVEARQLMDQVGMKTSEPAWGTSA